MFNLFSLLCYCQRLKVLTILVKVWFVFLLPVQQSAAQSVLNVWSSNGPAADIVGLTVDPTNAQIVYAGGAYFNNQTVGQVYKTISNGADWTLSGRIPGNPQIWFLKINPDNPNVIYAGTHGTFGGVYKSTNGGESWTPTNTPTIGSLEMAPSNPNILYALDHNDLHVSQNGGDSWEMRQLPIRGSSWFSLAVDPQDSRIIYINVNNYDEGGTYKSVNGGLTWTSLSLRNVCNDLEINPLNRNIIYCSGETPQGNSSGVYKSANGGASWTYYPIINVGWQMGELVVDPRNPDILYAAVGSYGVYKSTDGGMTWNAFNNGLPVNSEANKITRFAFDRTGKFLHAAARLGVFSVRVREDSNAFRKMDFDGDGRSDISVFRPSDRVWYLNCSTDGFSATRFGLSFDKITPADYDGDGKTDIAVFRDGTWFWLNSINRNFSAVHFGLANDIPVPADFTGDGRAELAVYRGGNWFTLNLSNNQFSAVRFGLPADKPVVGDYDGDGRADFAVYRDGTWYLLQSTEGFSAIQFGLTPDKLVPADYDGDGKTDLAVYRDGTWYLLQSSQGFAAFQFGVASDIPAPADYDGDGRADAAVYRGGNWYLQQSANGFAAVSFGLESDQPVPAAFLP